jgi:hypothetical protein
MSSCAIFSFTGQEVIALSDANDEVFRLVEPVGGGFYSY